MHANYHKSRNIGNIFNLMIWRSGSKSPNLYHHANLHRPTYYALSLLHVQPPNLISIDIKFQPDLVQIARFNDRQYFRIYGMYLQIYLNVCNMVHTAIVVEPRALHSGLSKLGHDTINLITKDTVCMRPKIIPPYIIMYNFLVILHLPRRTTYY